MISFLLCFLGTLLQELSLSIGKHETSNRQENIYSFVFSNLFITTIIYIFLGIIKSKLLTNPASFPTFGLRVLFELILMVFTFSAIAHFERSGYSFFKVLTIPCLLVFETLFVKAPSLYTVIGATVIVLVSIAYFSDKMLKATDLKIILPIVLIPVATLTLYKYNITHFNSVESEQGTLNLILCVAAFLLSKHKFRTNPIKQILANSSMQIQTVVSGFGVVLVGYAYYFAAPSIVTTVQRATALVFAVVAGVFYFKEKPAALRIFMGSLVVAGMFLIFVG